MASGSPETPLLTSITRGTGISGQLRPEVVGSLYPGFGSYASTLTAFATPAAGTYGNAGRDIITGPKQFSMSGSRRPDVPYRRAQESRHSVRCEQPAQPLCLYRIQHDFRHRRSSASHWGHCNAHLQHDREVPFLMTTSDTFHDSRVADGCVGAADGAPTVCAAGARPGAERRARSQQRLRHPSRRNWWSKPSSSRTRAVIRSKA